MKWERMIVADVVKRSVGLDSCTGHTSRIFEALNVERQQFSYNNRDLERV